MQFQKEDRIVSAISKRKPAKHLQFPHIVFGLCPDFLSLTTLMCLTLHTNAFISH